VNKFIARASVIVAAAAGVGISPLAIAAAGEIEEIVVTAQKRESNLQETPIAITAMTHEQIEVNRIEDVSDVALRTPSMTYNQLAGYSQVAIRGVGTDLTNLANETAVAMYEDGVYRGATFSQSVPQFDMERIEVLRGPQGTLYGRNATGGAINVITRLPSETPEFNGSFTGGDYDHIRLEIGLSGPLTDTILGRVSFLTDSHSGYFDNKTRDDSEGDDSFKGGHASALFKLSETGELILRGNYTRDHTSAGAFVVREIAPTALGVTPANVGGFLTFPNPLLGGLSLAQAFGLNIPQASPPIVVDPDNHDYYGNMPSKNTIKQYGGSATLTEQFGDVTAKLVVARQDAKFVVTGDSDGTDLPMLELNSGDQANRQNTAELNFSGTFWDGRATWLVGGFYFQEDGYAHFYYDLTAMQTTFEAIFGIFSPLQAPLPAGSFAVLPPFNEPRLKTGVPSATPYLDFRGNQDSTSYAGYGQMTIDLMDHLHLTLGARYTDDTKDMHRELTLNLGGPPCNQHINQNWNETTGQGTVSYDFSDDVMTYVSASKGFKSGGFNVAECAGAFDPETIWAYEIGTKANLLDRRLQLNAAAFLYNYDDIQINRFINNASSITNAAKADIYGAELELVALLGEGFEFDGGVTYLSTEYGGDASFSDPIIGGPPISVDGNDLLRSPPWKLYFGAQYTWETGMGRFLLRGDVTYSDKFYFDVFQASLPNQHEMKQDAYTITNARLQWDSIDGKYSGQLFCQNIGDELYANTAVAIGTTGSIASAYSTPRVFGLRVSMRMSGT